MLRAGGRRPVAIWAEGVGGVRSPAAGGPSDRLGKDREG